MTSRLMTASNTAPSRLALLLSLLLLALPACAAPVRPGAVAGGPAALAAPSERELLEIVETLAGPALAGRASGSPGMERAARYIAAEFARAGLRPGGEGGSFFQPFEVVTGIRLAEGNRLALRGGAGERDTLVGRDFTPFGFSDNGRAEGEVVFAGYGISAPELQYDDYAGVDVTGKIVLLLTGEPRERDPESPFRRPEAYRYTEARYKVLNAREHGARGVILVSSPLAAGDLPEQLFAIRGITSTSQSGILAVNALRRVAEELLGGAGRSLRELQAEVDRDLRPRSFLIPGRRAAIQVELIREHGRAWNVIGRLPGTDPRLREQAIVLGAHYDHLGLGGETSLAPARYGEIHPGADDNASGVAGVIGLARAFAAAGARRTLIFVAFAGEEMGLLGSAQYVRAPAVPLEQTTAMLNLDMIGRLKDETLYVFGVETGRELREALEAANGGVGLRLRLTGDGYGPSDHTPFSAKERPVLFFFTGPHEDYHRPSDTPDKINAAGLARVVRLVGTVLSRVADAEAPISFVRVEPSAPPRRGSGAGYGPYFGMIPEFGHPEEGVKLGGLRAGSPADQAGLQPGDLILRFDGKRVRNLEDFVFVLRSKRAGDRVEVVYRRGDSVRTTSALLGVRP